MLGKQDKAEVRKVAYFLMPQGRLYSKENFKGKFCTQISPSNNDNIVEQLRKSIIYRKKQISEGIIETNGTFAELQYAKESNEKGLFPLQEEDGKKKPFFFSKYKNFNR